MRKPIWIWTAGVSLILLLILFFSPGAPLYTLFHPVQSVLGLVVPESLNILEAPDQGSPVKSAARRLVQPFGPVQLVHVYGSKDSSAVSPAQR